MDLWANILIPPSFSVLSQIIVSVSVLNCLSCMPSGLDYRKQHGIMFWVPGTSEVSLGSCVINWAVFFFFFSWISCLILYSILCFFIVHKPLWPQLQLFKLDHPLWEEGVAKIHLCNMEQPNRRLLQPKYNGNNLPLFSTWI